VLSFQEDAIGVDNMMWGSDYPHSPPQTYDADDEQQQHQRARSRRKTPSVSTT
jgi:predicted TIM-barrel fold metal-dependent hydrolase